MQKFHFLPLAIPFLTGITISVTYFSSTYVYNHEPFFMPTISETGDEPPESCFFSWGVSNASFLLGIMLLLKYCHTKSVLDAEEQITQRNLQKWRTLNGTMFGFGIFSCICLNTVASFQSKNVPLVHYVAATAFFISVIVWMSLETRVSFAARDFFSVGWREPRWILQFRVTLIVVSFFTWLVGLTLAIIWGVTGLEEPYWHWMAVIEFVLVFWFLCYILSFWRAFQGLNVSLTVHGQGHPVVSSHTEKSSLIQHY